MIDIENYVATELARIYGDLDYTRYYKAVDMSIGAVEFFQNGGASAISKAQYLIAAMEMQISLSNFYKDDIYDIRMHEWPSTDYSHTKERMKRLEDLVGCIYTNWKILYDAYLNLTSQDPEVPKLTMNAMWR